MNLVLAHCGKEWRAQRALLLAFSLLTFACFTIGFLLLPATWWRDDGQRAFALSCFVAAGVIGAVAFAAPALVKGEFGAKGDQFVRRLPGALVPSFGGKLLFLVLAAVSLPLVGLVWGELFLQTIGQRCDDLFRWDGDGSVVVVWAWPALFCGYALLLAPWVWAVGTCLPGGRMAVGGVVLLVLLLGMGVVAVVRQHPNLERGIAWQAWLWWVPVSGVVVAAVAWVKGRRGGGPLRSARFGFAAMAIGLVPPSAWLGAEAWRYRHPDPQALVWLDVRGFTPDFRYALVEGNEHEEWQSVTFRVDLATGAAQQVAGLDRVLVPAGYGIVVSRWWKQLSRVDASAHWFDLPTGASTPLPVDGRGAVILSPEQQLLAAADARANTPFRAPGDRRVWLENEQVCIEDAAGGVIRAALTSPSLGLRAEGHGLLLRTRERTRLFDPTTLCFVKAPDCRRLLVRDVLLWQPRPWHWQRQVAGGEEEPCEPLRNAQVLGLVDDDRLLAVATERDGSRLFLFCPASGESTTLASLPEPAHRSAWVVRPLGAEGTLLPRDPAGRIWLWAPRNDHYFLMLLDVASSELEQVGPVDMPWPIGFLGWLDAHTALQATGTRIERIDITTGVRSTLFPLPHPAR